MRLFLGLPLSQDAELEIARWRDQSLPAFARPVPHTNFHLTLTFLGEVSRQQKHDLIGLAEAIRANAFTLTLDQVGYWPKQEVFYLSAHRDTDRTATTGGRN